MSGHRGVIARRSAVRALCPEAQARLDALAEERGVKFAAKALGCTEHMVERLRYGGKAMRDAVDRVQARCYAEEDPYWQALLAGGRP